MPYIASGVLVYDTAGSRAMVAAIARVERVFRLIGAVWLVLL